MKKITTACVIVCVCMIALMACNEKAKPVGNNQLSQDETKDGWALLFDGKSTMGWHKYGGTTAGSAWKVDKDSGTLYLDTTIKEGWQIKDGGDILTAEEYENFHLKLDWKIAKDGNSGIIFYVNEDTTKYKYGWMTGPEMQVLDNAGHADSKIIKHRAGDLYDLITVTKETVNPYNVWNKAEVIANKGDLKFVLNADTVVRTTMWDTAWTGMIARSKFKEFPGFGTYKKGRIMLQDHGNTVWYRNVKIKKL